MTRTKRANRLLSLLLVLFMVLALLPVRAQAATPSEVGQGFSVTCSDSTFTITRSDTSAAASVKYRTVSQSALAGIHFTAASGTLSFVAGENSKTVKVAETRATATEDFFYMSGSTRTYGFEVMAASNNQLLASCQRTLDNSADLALSSGLYSAKSATVFTDEYTVTDKNNYNQASFTVPVVYNNSEKAYLLATGAQLRMTVDFEAKEADDGYQYIQILPILQGGSATPDSGAGSGDPGTVSHSSYMAGFGHEPGTKNTTYAKYTFPLTTAGDNCAAIDAAWNFSPYNNTVGKLYTQKFGSSARADDGRVIIPTDYASLLVLFDASGDSGDDWYAKNVIASLQAVDTTAPTITNAYVSEGTYGYRDTVTVALRFSEVVRNVNGTPYLNTNFGNFSYGGGAGTNVLYFAKQMNDSTPAVNGLQITGLANAEKIKDLAGNVFSSFSGFTFSGVTYEGSLSVTINYNNGTGATGDAGRRRLNATYTFPSSTYVNQAPTGYEFDCFKVGETSYHAGDTLELTGDLTVDLQWKPIVYTVRFVNWDGTELQSGLVPYGTVPAYTGETPTRLADAQYTYTFAGWDQEITAVSGDTTYTAAYSTTTNEYTVTFKNYDGTVLQTSSVPYGETPAYTGETPAKEQTAEKTHTFAGWTPNIVPVTGDATYTATFTDAVRTYTITFAGYDGTVLQSGSVAYGETPAYTGSTPVRADEGETRYTFTGWTPAITAVIGEATYTAAYTTAQLYPITLPEGVAADKAFAVPGETVTLTVTAPAAYTVAVTYIPAGSSPVSIPETEGACTFAMPAAPVTVGADFSLTWAGLQTLLNAGGTVRLLCDVTAEADSSFLEVPAGVTVTLDLNGHTVDRALTEAVSSGNVLQIYGSLTLGDSSAGGAGHITGGNSTGDGGGVCAFGKFIMEGGTISGNSANRGGGGVYVGVDQTFTMSGGTITGNTASNGGGVYVNGTFSLSGGTITNNSARFDGGGVYVNGTFSMEGGTITGNTAGYDGCGVYNSGTFSVSGSPVVTGNLDGIDPNNVYLCNNKRINLSGPLTDGAALGVRMYNIYGIFTIGWADMMGTADPAAYFTSDRSDYAYQVYLSGGEAAQGQFHTVTVADGIAHGAVTADKASAVSGDTVTLTVTPEAGYALDTLTVRQGEMDLTTTAGENGVWTFVMSGGDVTVTAAFIMTWSSLNDALWSDCTITLPYDVTAGSGNGQLIIPSGVTVTLDLNGHTLDRGLSDADAASNGIAVAVRGGASLTVKDSAGGGRITGGNSSGLCGGVHVRGSFIMEGGTISGNTASANGGGVYVNGGSFTMKGGAISGNTPGSYGGGVYVNSGAFTMEGGAITNNKANYGGGVYVSSGSFTMEGGAITGNTASVDGGGVCVSDNGAFNITGGTISGNTASDGGGVFVYGTFSVGGSPVVTGNTKQSYGTANNVYLSSGKCITVTGGLSDSASLGVTMKDSTGVFTSGWAAQMDTASPADFFISDNSAYAAHLGTGGEAELGQAYAVSVTDGIAHGTVTADRASACAGDTVTLTVTADSGYELDTLNVMQGETAVDVTNNRFTMPNGDVTVTATFKETAAPPVLNAQVFGHNLTLKGEIGINTFLILGNTITENASDYQVEYWSGDKLVSSAKVSEVSPTTKESGGNSYTVYPFTVTTVAKEMDTVFTMKIKGPDGYIDFANSNGATVTGGTGLDYSITAYLDDRIANSSDPEMVTLAKDMKAYCIYSRHYFDVRDHGSTEALPGIAGFETVTADELSAYAYTLPQNIEHFTYKGCTLILEEMTSFRLYFESDDTGSLTIKNGESTLTIHSGTGSYRGMYYVEITNISAQHLDDMYDFSISNGTVSTTTHHGPLGYAKWALGTDKETLKYAMMALWHYNRSADAYFN